MGLRAARADNEYFPKKKDADCKVTGLVRCHPRPVPVHFMGPAYSGECLSQYFKLLKGTAWGVTP